MLFIYDKSTMKKLPDLGLALGRVLALGHGCEGVVELLEKHLTHGEISIGFALETALAGKHAHDSHALVFESEMNNDIVNII